MQISPSCVLATRALHTGQVTGQVILDCGFRDLLFSLGLWASGLVCPGLSHKKRGSSRLSGHLHSDWFPALRSSGILGSGFYQIPEGTGLPLRPLSGSFLSLHPYKPIIPSRSLRGAFPTPQHFRGGSGTQIPQSRAPRAEEIQRRPRLLNSLAFVSYLPSFQGSSNTPDLVSAQAQQNSPARLPRSRHPGDRANSDQSASEGRGSPGALL